MERALNTPFFGRERELQRLQRLKDKRTASLVVLKGRRRIGKCRLTDELAGRLPRYKALHFQGLAPDGAFTAELEREDFARQLQRELHIPLPRADDWNTLLWTLADRTAEGRHLIILDEINWLGRQDPTFLSKLKNAWDLHLSKNPQLILILSGSMTHWIERNILHSTGFMGRISLDLTLRELPLATCNLFWGEDRHNVSAYEKIRLLSVTGGIPRYLEEMDTSLSADANIQRMCFTPEGFLFNEFEHIFADLFSSRTDIHRRIVKALIDGPLNLEELYSKLGIEKDGTISEHASELVQAGLLARDFTWNLETGLEGKISKLRLSDNCLRFYLKFIEPNRSRIERDNFPELPGIDSILGLQIENLVLHNRHSIFQRLGINPANVVYDNPFFQRQTRRRKGSQIDYLIQTREPVLYICEIKHSRNPIPASVAGELHEKIRRLQIPKHMGHRSVLIHVGALTASLEDDRSISAKVDLGQCLIS